MRIIAFVSGFAFAVAIDSVIDLAGFAPFCIVVASLLIGIGIGLARTRTPKKAA